jgi:hypothetical protein
MCALVVASSRLLCEPFSVSVFHWVQFIRATLYFSQFQRITQAFLPLPLLVFGVGTNDINDTTPSHNLAIATDFLN